ncbi:MAG: adenylosuccinate lyase family protein [Gammaproteobacteria bacterium]|nr:adenylosuccinate lyase family protein [Gammaproteobacteria bacterium]
MKDEPTALRVPDPGIRALYTLQSRWQSWLDVEVALARAEAELGMIPAAAAAVIAERARMENLDLERIEAARLRTGHSIVPLVWELSRVCGEEAGGYVHWGATTQNIIDTGEVLLLRQAHRIILGQLGRLLRCLGELAERTASTPLPGRTHGQHAVPATFGYKVAVWIDELARAVERLRGLETRAFASLQGGAAGTLASFGEQGFELAERIAAHLQLAPMQTPSRAQGDRRAEYVCNLGILAATCGKIGREVYTLMKQEFGELEEPVPPGTVGSSTMPQKRNPKLAQDVIAGSMEIRHLVPLALESMITEHEADRTTSITLRHAIEPALELTGDVLERLVMIMEGLRVDEARMRRNLDLSGGMILAESVMLELGRHVGRQLAHDLVYEAAQAVATDGGAFSERLAADPRIAEHVPAEVLDGLLDPTAYTGLCVQMAQDQARRALELADTLV